MQYVLLYVANSWKKAVDAHQFTVFVTCLKHLTVWIMVCWVILIHGGRGGGG